MFLVDMISISSVVSSPSSCTYYEVIGKFEHVVCELIFHDKLTLTLFFVWASIVATHFVICICIKSAIFMWYYSFVDLFKSYLRFACTCVFAPNTNGQIYPVHHHSTYTKSRSRKDRDSVRIHLSHSGLKIFFFYMFMTHLKIILMYRNIYSRIGPVNHNWNQCGLNWVFCLLMEEVFKCCRLFHRKLENISKYILKHLYLLGMAIDCRNC